MKACFKSSYSKGMLLATSVLSVVIVVALVLMGLQLANASAGSMAFMVYVAAFVLVFAAAVYAFVSQIDSVCLTSSDIIINKKVGRIVIPKKNIVHMAHKPSMSGDIRLCGVGGLFGRTGLFWSKGLGRYEAYVKDGNSLIEIKTTGKTYVVSCDNYQQLLSSVNA